MSGLMRGLAVGDQQAISADAWRVFAKTGTTHLVAISGFHIGVVAAFFGVLCGGFARVPQAQRWRLTRADARAIGTIAGGLLYSALAGFSVPTQRTLLMLCVYFATRLLRRCVSPWRSLALALVSIVMLDPLAPLTIGFWLSFGAVGVILLAVDGRLAVQSKWREHVRMQSVVTVGLAPVLVAAFSNVSLIAPWVNLIAIPFVSLVAVPGVLIGLALLAICPPLGAAMLQATAHLLEWTWPALEWCAHLPLATWYLSQRPLWTLLLALAGALLWATPLSAVRLAGLALCVPVIVWPAQRLEQGAFELAILDVGQGLAVVVRTRSHALIYDTGPAFRSGRDTGELVVVPYLHHLGISHPDMLVLSHGDLDHVGGVKSVLAALDVKRVLRGPSVSTPGRVAETCIAGETWRWDAVEFAVLHPSNPHDLARNNSSCVIEIRNAGGRALIMGDVERESELALLERGAISQTDVVVAAHHGSRTSSTQPFVQATHARHVIFSAGWGNRWGFPRPDVVERWQEQGATSYTTFRSGAIEIMVTPRGIANIGEYRIEHPHYWRQGATRVDR
jgi:competence protein ComEC